MKYTVTETGVGHIVEVEAESPLEAAQEMADLVNLTAVEVYNVNLADVTVEDEDGDEFTFAME